MKDLKRVDSFGAIDADNDDLLLSSFEDHEAFLEIVAFRRFLVVGRKGSGKTAIYKRLQTLSENDYFCAGHTFADYPWHHHNLQARTGIPDFDKFTHSWKYLVLLTTSKILLNYDNSLPFDDRSMQELVRLERFVLDSYGTRDPDVTEIFSPTKKLRLRPHFDLDWKFLKAGVSPEAVPIPELPVIVQELNRNLLRAVVTCLNPEHRYYVCFDQLDLGFDPGDPNYSHRLVGLLLAARDLNIAARDAGKRLLIVVFLRDDIYDLLQFEDKNKLTENFLSLIEWDTPRTDKTLRELMEKRFTAVLGDASDQAVSWGSVFNEKREMPGHQTKYQYLLDRTYLRPRDIIKFCNAVLTQFKSRSREGDDAPDRFDNVDVNGAKLEFSNYLMNELDDEIHKHVSSYRDYMDIIRAVGQWQFERTEFEKQWQARSPGGAATAHGALEHLFHFSVIGFYRPGGRGYGGSEYVFRYKEPMTSFDPTASRFRVHPGLMDFLGLRRM